MRVKTIGSLGYHRPDVVTLHGAPRGMGGFFTTPEIQEDPISITLRYPQGYTSGLSLSLAKNPVLWSLGLFAAGWAGGYFTWVAIGRGR